MGFGVKWSWGHAGSQVGAGTQALFLIYKMNQVGYQGHRNFPWGDPEHYSTGRTVKHLSRFDTKSETRVGTRHLKFSQKSAAVSTSCILCIMLSYVIVFTSPNITWHYFVHLFICLFTVCLSDQNISISEPEPYLFCSLLDHQLLE